MSWGGKVLWINPGLFLCVPSGALRGKVRSLSIGLIQDYSSGGHRHRTHAMGGQLGLWIIPGLFLYVPNGRVYPLSDTGLFLDYSIMTESCRDLPRVPRAWNGIIQD